MSLPTDSKSRKEHPIFSGVLNYFPDAIAYVAHVSYKGNEKHNPGQPLHWSREKSSDHKDCIARHLTEVGGFDSDGLRHSGTLAWRALANLQLELEAAASNRLQPAPEGACPTTGPVAAERWAQEYDKGIAALHAVKQNPVHPYWDQVTDPREKMVIRLEALGCKSEIARSIAAGTTFTKVPVVGGHFGHLIVYISGAMRGHVDDNFPKFDAARDAFLRRGWDVISPADIDRQAGRSEDEWVYIERDYQALKYVAKEGGAIAVIPGWERSRGTLGEFGLARWGKIPILTADPATVDVDDISADLWLRPMGFHADTLIDAIRMTLERQA